MVEHKARIRISRPLWYTLIIIPCTLVLGAQLPQTTPVTISAGPDWIPLQVDLDILPGSALDFSQMGLHKGPAGSHGRVIATRDGQFAFEDRPDSPQRFYGVNLCVKAQYVSHREADRLAERLMRLGYNTVRLHHYESPLVEGQSTTTTFNPERLDQLDYLFAALAKRGIYISTDLYVSRPVTNKEIGIGRPGTVGMDRFKILVPVYDAAFQNWKQFSRALLDHVNPYTGKRYADDPALAWLSLINEGNFTNFFSELRNIGQWRKAWNAWLAKRYSKRAALAAAWGDELKETEDPSRGTVGFPDRLNAPGIRARDCMVFLADADSEIARRMIGFVREDLRCRALLTNTNGWINYAPSQQARTLYDYVDDHFYVDHPQFLKQNWQLPSRCPNLSPVAQGADGGRDRCFTRLFDKPFTISEYNYAGPGRFRGVGGILTGAMGALQGWSAIYRFAYSHDRASEMEPAPIDYFDMASDPLGQASERAAVCLFLRGDMKTAPHTAALVMTRQELTNPPERVPRLAPRWHWAGWLTRIGTFVPPETGAGTAFTAVFSPGWGGGAGAGTTAAGAYQIADGAVVSLLRERGILSADNPSDPAKRLFVSETGEITIDGPSDDMILDTPRTAGGYATAGRTIRTRDGVVAISMGSSDATVWVSSLDGRPIAASRRLLVTHLTDLQNSNTRYGEDSRQTLLAWGGLPHLVRAGEALVRLKIEKGDSLAVWALSTGGRRVASIPCSTSEGILQFKATVAGDGANGARFMYEVSEP
jgi:hypothetical protein